MSPFLKKIKIPQTIIKIFRSSPEISYYDDPQTGKRVMNHEEQKYETIKTRCLTFAEMKAEYDEKNKN